jgi:hypothetical protein
MDPLLASIPSDWEIIIWDNSALENLAVYGRYAAIEFTDAELIYVQADDVFVTDPQALVEEWMANGESPGAPDGKGNGHLVANMPQEFRHDGYTDSCLVGFGAVFHRDAPARAFERFEKYGSISVLHEIPKYAEFFHRTCDVVFTTLTPRVLMDIERIDREFATDPNRMYRQPEHFGERKRMLELARQVRDS